MSKLSKEEILNEISSIQKPKELIELHKKVCGVDPVCWGETRLFPYEQILDAIILGQPYEEKEPKDGIIY